MKKSLLSLSSLMISLSSISFITSCFGADRLKPPEAHKYLDSYIIKTLKLDTIKSVKLEVIDGEVTINFDDLIISNALQEIKNLALKNEESPEFRFLKEQDILKEHGDFDISKTTLNFSKTVLIVNPIFTENAIKFTHLICELHVFKEENTNMALKNTYKIELHNNDFTITNLNDFKNKAENLTLTDFNVDNSIIKDINKAHQIAVLSNKNDLFKLAQFFGQPIFLDKAVINNALSITLKIDKYFLVKNLSLKI